MAATTPVEEHPPTYEEAIGRILILVVLKCICAKM